MQHAAQKPVIVELLGQVTVKDVVSGEVRNLDRHERTGTWTLMAVIDLEPGKPVAVFENFQTDHGSMIYVDTTGVLLELPKSLEPAHVAEETCYRGHAKADVVQGDRDILREELLSLGRDPTFDEIRACFPPIRRFKHGDLEGPHTFVGSRDAIDLIPIYYDARRGVSRVNPLAVTPEIVEANDQQTISEGLVGGWLPVVRFSYPLREGVSWESLTFAVVDPPTPFIQPAWYRYLKLDHGVVAEARYFDSYLPYPNGIEPDPERFYAELYALHAYWNKALDGSMTLDLPEPWIADFSRHAMVQEMITRVGNHPRYGVVDRNYGAPEHDGFQDTLNASVNCYLEWGLFDVARGYLENYLTTFVRADGSIHYRGPEIGQYARMLTNLAQFYDYTGDDGLLLTYHDKIDAIVSILMRRREAAKKRPQTDAAYGMIAGWHEADIGFATPTLATLDYDQPYISNSTEAWRGFTDLGRAWMSIGKQRDDSKLVARAQSLLDEAAGLRDDIVQAIERSILHTTDMPYLPPIAGSKELHLDAPYRSRPESWDDNRVWSEMMHSGVVPKETIETILAYLAAHNGTTLGIFNNRHSVVAFQCYGEAYGLIQHDMIHEALLFFYAHALHLHTRGTWSVFECVDMDRERAEHTGYCIPAQVTIPTVTKWLLLFEDPLSDTLWLAKATPRVWLEHGKRIGVRGAPTRWGKLDYTIESRVDDGVIRARIHLPARMPAEVRLRLRTPQQTAIQSVRVNGQTWSLFDPAQETISITDRVADVVDVEVFYR